MTLGWLQCLARGLSLGIALATCAGAAVAQTSASASKEPGRYFLVIDHSGSMLAPILKGPDAGRSRWDLMRQRAVGFVDRLPNGAHLWAIVFSAKDPAAPSREWHQILSGQLDSPMSRQRLTAQMSGFPEPGSANGTWLYQATDKALDQAEAAGTRDPDAFLTVLVYTDGVDEGHGKTRSEMQRNPGSQVTRAQLESRVQRLRQRFRNFNLLTVYQPGDESIRDAHVVRLETNRLQLANPQLVARQELKVNISFRDNDVLQLKGRPLALALEAEDGKPLPLQLTGGPFRLEAGTLTVGVERSGHWPPGKDVKARLKLGYPSLDGGAYLVAEGGDSVDLLIQGAEAPTIRDLLPVPGSVFPVGRTVTYSLTTLPGAAVAWDFGDGRSAQGNPVSHTFTEPGKRSVTVKVTDPRTQLQAMAKLPLEAVRLAVTLDPPLAPLVPDRQLMLTATAEGEFERYVWSVGGRHFVGAPRMDGIAGTSLSLSFERPGPVTVSVTGQGRSGGLVESPPLQINVKEVPALRVTSPASQDSLYFGSSREFKAEVEGVDASQVRFALMDAHGHALLEPKDVDIARQGPTKLATIVQKIPTLQRRTAARLRVEALGANPPLLRELPVVLEREATLLEVVVPGGRELHIHKPVSLALQANLPLTDIRWDFGEGSGLVAGTELERHVWTRYGDYVVRAVARDPEGQVVESTPVALKVPIRPVTAKAALVYEGKAVGHQVDRVPVNATLQLRPEVAGDVLELRWFLDAQELPKGDASVTVSKRGEHRLRLIATGTPEAGSEESTISFRVSDPYLYWGGMGLLLALAGLLGRLLLGNKWRFAEFRVLTDGDAFDQRDAHGDPRLDAELRRLGKGTDGNCGRWNWLTKRALLSMQQLDNRLAVRVRNDRYRRFAFAWKTSDCIAFTGMETPKPLGGLANDKIRLALTGDRINPGRSNGWQRCWIVPRPGGGPRPPADAPECPSYSTLALFMRLRKRATWQIYWPEFVFATALSAGLLAARYLHTTFY